MKEQSFLAYQVASIKKNWRTFLTCLALGGSAWVALFPAGWDEWTVQLARGIFVASLPLLGVVTKDASTTGTAHANQSPRLTADHLPHTAAGNPTICDVCGKSVVEHWSAS